MNYQKVNNLVGWATFALAFIVYALTVSPTASFWDCGEFIACSNELQVPHPPGAPLYLMVGRLFAMFGSGEGAAFMVNMLSVLASAFTVLFTFWTITILGRRAFVAGAETPSQAQTIALMGAGVVGAMAACFADSIWFNAVEAEVYAISSFFTAVVFWLIFKWDARANEPNSNRWLLLIAYVMGLSIGTHLLNLLTIPALALAYYFRRYTPTVVGSLAAMGVGALMLVFILYGMIMGTFDVAWFFERVFTGYVDINAGTSDGMGMPFGTGSLVWFAMLISGLTYGIWWSQRKQRVNLNTLLLSVLVIYLGISSYAMVMIRANAQPSINENDPSNMLTFLQYMKREQYGDRPLLSGPMYNAVPIAYEEGKGKGLFYKFDSLPSLEAFGPATTTLLRSSNIGTDALNSRYVLYEHRRELEYDPRSVRTFPRMHSAQHYGTATGGPGAYWLYVSDENKGPDKTENSPQDDAPSGGDNLKFFFKYQVGHMYLRYFGWNFIGRMSDSQDEGIHLGSLPAETPERLRNEPSRNTYYALPLILGLLGMVWHFGRRNRDATVVALFFFFTGLAIIIYLNQTPMQPRERDYSYAGSFQAFALWIGLGVLAVKELLLRYVKGLRPMVAASLASVMMFLAVPFQMGVVNWRDHSRAGNYLCPDSARSLLESCARNGILFTNGDNDTFPLWYLQEVEGVRTDVRVVNLSLLNTSWYIHQLKKSINGALPVSLSLPETFYMGDRNQSKPFSAPVQEVLPVDREAVIRNGLVPAADSASIVPEIQWTIPLRSGPGYKYLQKQDLMIIDILKSVAAEGWERPVYFATTVPPSSFIGLDDYFQQEGLTYRIVPRRFPKGAVPNQPFVNTDIMYENMIHKFLWRNLQDENAPVLDEQAERMLMNVRTNYVRLALELVGTIANDRAAADTLAKAGRTTEADALRGSFAQRVQRAQEVLDYMNKHIADAASYIDPYVLGQMADVYATIAEEGGNTQDNAIKYYNLAVQRASEELKFWVNIRGFPLQDFPRQYYAFRIAAMGLAKLNKPGEAKQAAQLFQAYTGSDDVLRQVELMLRERGNQAPAAQDTAPPNSR